MSKSTYHRDTSTSKVIATLANLSAPPEEQIQNMQNTHNTILQSKKNSYVFSREVCATGLNPIHLRKINTVSFLSLGIPILYTDI